LYTTVYTAKIQGAVAFMLAGACAKIIDLIFTEVHGRPPFAFPGISL